MLTITQRTVSPNEGVLSAGMTHGSSYDSVTLTLRRKPVIAAALRLQAVRAVWDRFYLPAEAFSSCQGKPTRAQLPGRPHRAS